MLVFGCCKVYKSPETPCMPDQDSPSAVLTGFLVVNHAGRPSPACPDTRLTISLPHLMDLPSKSRHLQLKRHQQAGREHKVSVEVEIKVNS